MFLRKDLLSLVAAFLFLSIENVQSFSVLNISQSASPDSLVQLPHQALIACVTEESVYWKCNGAIINERFVATTATCVHTYKDFLIRLGNLISGNSLPDETITYKSQPGTLPFYHPDFNENKKYEFDLALLKTEMPIAFSHAIQPVSIPDLDEVKLADNAELVTSGFAEENLETRYISYTTVSVLPDHVCNRSFTFKYGTMKCVKIKLKTTNGHLCGGTGLPLVLKRDNRTLVGIYQNEATNNCTMEGPYSFTNINPFIPWIKRIAKSDKCFCKKKYFLGS